MNITKMGESIKIYFEKIAKQEAKETQFVQRKSKMNGSVFLITWVFGLLNSAQSSLNDLSMFCQDHFDISITSQGLDERIHEITPVFMKKMFSKAIEIFQQTISLPLSVLKQFSAVNITDSTGISLPESLSEEFPGSGGDASKSGLKIQLIFDFLKGCFKAITITDGITPDQKFTEHIDIAEPNSLNLFDLGYFAIKHLKGFYDKGAYFLCRLLPGTNLFEENGDKLDLIQLLKNQMQQKFFELNLLIGQVPCRVCFFKAPEEVINRRRQKVYKNSSKKGRTPGKQILMLSGWTILITNVPASMLSLKHIA